MASCYNRGPAGILLAGLLMRLTLLALLVLSTAPAQAQPDRYELGRRLHDFEVAWDQHADDAAAKKRAAPLVKQAFELYFQFDFPGVARKVDAARHALVSSDPAKGPVSFADALQIVPEKRVVDAATDELTVTLKAFYKPDAFLPKIATLRAKIGNGKSVEAQFEKLPVTIKVPIKDVPGQPSADLKLTAEVVYEDKVIATRVIGVARVEKLAERVAAIKKAAKEVPSPPATIEQATQLLLASLVDDLAGGKVLETDYPASRLVFGSERLAKVTEPYYVASRPGEFWLSVPTGKTQTIIRIRIPPKLEEKKTPVPILFALHGLSGSENLFFDGYGNGIIPRLATERGWIVVATRVSGPLGSGPAPEVAAILDELSKRYPIDSKRVYLIGHSLGAAHAMQLAQKHPGKFAALAALGGGAKITNPDALKDLPVFVGCGNLDVVLPIAKALHKSLDEAKAKVTFKEYEDIEHMLIVRESAADVFKFFEK
jgi:alpha/beta hydrolase fold